MPRWLLLRGCEAIWCAYFLSLWAYKTWYIATAAVFGVAAVLGALRWLRVRGIVQAALERHPRVVEFWDDPGSHLGATMARLASQGSRGSQGSMGSQGS